MRGLAAALFLVGVAACRFQGGSDPGADRTPSVPVTAYPRDPEAAVPDVSVPSASAPATSAPSVSVPDVSVPSAEVPSPATASASPKPPPERGWRHWPT